MEIVWEKIAKEKFHQMIARVPSFLQSVAETKILKKAESLAKNENRHEVIEKDLVAAFFMETPFGFHGPMKTDMKELGIDYVKYGYQE